MACGSARAVVGLQRLAGSELEALHVGQPPGGAGEAEAERDPQQRDEPLPAGDHLEVEERAHGVDREDPGEDRAEARDQREHVALDGDVLATWAAFEQDDEAEAEHDQCCRRRGATVLEVPPKTPSTRKNESSDAIPIAIPAGNGERGERLQQPPAVERALAGREREHEGGDPDRDQRGDGELARQEREREVEDRREDDQKRGVDRLRQVQATEAMDVARDPAALADRAREHRELVAQQDDVGDALGDLAARAHRHGELACLSAGTSLTPSPIIAV